MDRKGRLRRRLALILGAALAALGPLSPADAAPEPPDIAAAAGIWELSLEGSHRRCRLNLAVEPAGIGRILRYPFICRRALPILTGTTAWLADARELRLLDTKGEPVLRFEFQPDDEPRTAKAITGEVFRLERPEDLVQEVRLQSPPPAPPLPPLGVPQPTPIDPDKAPRPETLPGLYVVDRYSEREVCRVNLGRAMLTASGRFEARIMEGCRDLGIAMFDPIAWRYEGGRLTLTARRGHEVTLVSERDGHWRRDPEVGATLILRKVQAP